MIAASDVFEDDTDDAVVTVLASPNADQTESNSSASHHKRCIFNL